MIDLKSNKSKNIIKIVLSITFAWALILSSFVLINKNNELVRMHQRRVAFEKKVKIMKFEEYKLQKKKLAELKAYKKKIDKINKKRLAKKRRLAKIAAKKKRLKLLAAKRKKEMLAMLKKEQKQNVNKNSSLTAAESDASNSENGKTDTTVSAASPVANSSNNTDIGSQLKSAGLGDAQVSAVVANLNRESSLNPNANNGVGNEGLAQWGGSRLSNLKAQCGGLGTSNCQVNFLLNEMKSGINGFNINTFNSYSNADAANAYFKSTFEGAA